MKIRLTILVIILSLALAACSLAEDITPPANYASPTSLPTIVTSTQTRVPTSTTAPTPTSEQVTTTTETVPATTDSTTPPAEVSPTVQPNVVVSGTVTVASGTPLSDGTTATLLVYSMTSGQVTQTLTAPIQPDGKYEFTNVPAETTIVYLVTVEYSDVTYSSTPAQFDGTIFQFELPITVYKSTSDLNVLNITQAHLQFDFSTAGELQVMALYVISNPSANSVIATSDGSSIPFIQIPEGAGSVEYQLAQSSSPLINATNGFALLPGSDKQYGIITSFTLPYTNRLVFSQPFSLPVSSATIIMPEGVRVRSDQLTDAGTQSSTTTPSTTYHLYQASSLASGSTLTMTISGMPGDKAGYDLDLGPFGFYQIDQRTLLMIGVGALGLILIGLGVFLFLRDRKLRKLEDEFEGDDEEDGEDALGEDRDSIMDAIIALDDQYKAGEVSKEAYEKRRDELKERLKNLV